MKILNVVGARPNFMKVAPLMEAYGRLPSVDPVLVHTGQHYDPEMSELFFEELGIPEPDVNLGVGSGSHAQQTAAIMSAFETILLQETPDAVLVVGDVNSTVACGLVAVKLEVQLIHVEAGLRSGDRSMPEEINRILTDAMSDLLFCTEESGVRNLMREGVAPEKVHLVGNVMVDTVLKHLPLARASDTLDRFGLEPGKYALLTLHRPSNVDGEDDLDGILDALEVIQRDLPVIFPAHPRTEKMLRSKKLAERVRRLPRLRIIPPAGYLEFVSLMDKARVVLTDSGGIQEETTMLRVPCLTLRDNTERPVTVECGTNQLVGNKPDDILRGYSRALDFDPESASMPPLWDGRAAERIVDLIGTQLRPTTPTAHRACEP